jgi:cytidylate kinase
MYRLDAWRCSGRDVGMRDRHVTETEMTQALQRALLHATDEVVGDKRAISADVYCDCLVGLFLAASPQSETPEEIEQFVAQFRDKLTAALARRGVVGHA